MPLNVEGYITVSKRRKRKKEGGKKRSQALNATENEGRNGAGMPGIGITLGEGGK